MPTMSQALSYKGFTIYTDGRVYKDHYLMGQFKTLAAAKAAATRFYKQMYYV